MPRDSAVAEAIERTLQSPNCPDSNGEIGNVVDGLYRIAEEVGIGLKYLGNGNAGTEMGAIEGHAKIVSEALRDGLFAIAAAIRYHADTVCESAEGEPR